MSQRAPGSGNESPASRSAGRPSASATREAIPALASPGARLARRLALHEPPALELRDGGAARLLAPTHFGELDLSRYALVVDLGRGEVRVGGRRRDRSRHPMLLELLGELARDPGAAVPSADLFARVWGVGFHPLRHQGRVTMSVARLRRLLGASAVETGAESYRLVRSRTWAVIRPL